MTQRTSWLRSPRLGRKWLSAHHGERSPTGNSRLRNRRLMLERLEDRQLLALVSYWTGDNAAADSISGNDGTLYNGATYAAGQVGQAFSFDGVNDRVNVADSPSFKLTQSLSIEGWVRVDGLPTVPSLGEILFRGDDRGGRDPYQLAVSSTGNFAFYIDSLTTRVGVTTPIPSMGEPLHVAATLDDASGAMRLYINGVRMAQSVTAIRPFADLDPASNPGIGIGNHGGHPTTPHNFPFHGLIDELKLYDHALTAEEVLANFNATKGDLLPNISISDATVSERGGLTAFTSSNVGILENSADVAFGPSRNSDATPDLYVVGRFSDNIVVYDGTTGALVEELVGPESGLDGPAWILIGPDGDVFTSTFTASGKRDGILRFDQATGTVSMFFVDTNVSGAKGMAFGADGHFYLADTFNDRILKYDGATGAFLGEFIASGTGGLDDPGAILFGPDRNSDGADDLYVSSFFTDNVLVFSGVDGTSLGVFVATGSGGLDGPHDMEFGPDGHLYVVNSETSNEKVYRFDGTTGAFLDIVIPSGIEPETAFITFDRDGNLYVASERTHNVLRYSAGPIISLSSPSALPVTVEFGTADAVATSGSDYGAISGQMTFAPGETSKRFLVSVVDDSAQEGNETFLVNLSNATGSIIADGQGVVTIIDNDAKFYVVDDASTNRTYEYGSSGAAGENYALSSGNTAPRGAASTAAGDKVWVVDANKNVYVYGPSGNPLDSWTAGSLNAAAQVEGIATNGTDIWIVDAKQDKVFRYTGAASRTSGSQNAASSFSLNKSNINPKDIVTDGTSLWVVDDSSTDKVFKYNLAGSLLGSWTITGGGGSPSGITLEPGPSPSNGIWIVDSATDRVYEFANARGAISGSIAATNPFVLASGNGNPQGIADPPVGGSPALDVTEVAADEVVAIPVLAGFPAVAATGQISTQTGDQDSQDALALYLSEVGNPAAVLSADAGAKTKNSVAGTSLSLSSFHDDALCGIADELESLVPGRRARLRR
jgi:hypothetical protein